jgi:hypothetical protein
MKLGGTNQRLSLVPSIVLLAANIVLAMMVLNGAPVALMWVAIPLGIGGLVSCVKYYVLRARKNAHEAAELEELLSATR